MFATALHPRSQSRRKRLNRPTSNAPSHRLNSARRRLLLEHLEERRLLADDYGFAFDIGGPSGKMDSWAIATNQDANVYVSGRFQGIVDFNPAHGEQTTVDNVEVFRSALGGTEPDTHVFIDASSDLQIVDSDGGDTNDSLTLSISSGNIRVADPNNLVSAGNGAIQVDSHTVEVPLAAITGGDIKVGLFGGDDVVEVQDLGAGGFTGALTIHGGADNDTLDASAMTLGMTLDGRPGNDILTGGSGNDTLIDGAGDDTLTGNAGDDTFVLTPGSADSLNDSDGDDTVDFSGAAAGVTIDMDTTAAQAVSGTDTVQLNGRIENFVGSNFADTVRMLPLAVPRNVEGNDPAAAPGDTLIVDGQGQQVSDNSTQIAVPGFQPIGYSEIETVDIRNEVIHWAAAVNGYWSEAAKWDAGRVPGADDIVYVAATGSNYTVTLNTGAYSQGPLLSALNLNNTLVAGTGDFISQSHVDFNDGSTIATGVSLINESTFYVRGIGATSTHTIDGAFTNAATGTVLVQAYGVWEGPTVTTTFTVTAGMTNVGTLTLDSKGQHSNRFYRTTMNVTGGRLVNTGLIQSLGQEEAGDAYRDLDAELDNQGTIDINNNSTVTLNVNSPGANHVNSGAINVNNGALSITGIASFENTATGTINGRSVTLTGEGAGTGATLTNAGNITLANGGLTVSGYASVANSGSIDVSGGDSAVSSYTTLTNSGETSIGPGRTLTVSGGTFVHQDPGTLTGEGAATFNSSTLDIHGTFTVDIARINLSGVTGTGSGTIDNRAFMDLRHSTFGSGISLINRDYVNVDGNGFHNSNTVEGPFDNKAGATLRLLSRTYWGSGTSSANLTLGDGLTNSGSILLQSYSYSSSFVRRSEPKLVVTSGTLTNTATGVIDSQPYSPNSNSGWHTIEASLDNAGTINIDWPTNIDKAGARYANSGSIHVNVNTSISGIAGFDNSGLINGPRNLSLTGGTATDTFTCTGTVDLDAGLSLSNFTGVYGTGTLGTGVTATSSNVNPGLSPGVLNIVGSYVQGSGNSLNIEIGGDTPGNGPTFHDQINVTGTVNITNAALNLSSFGGYVPVGGESFVMINNDGTDLVSGTFAGMTEGATISNDFLGSGRIATITYQGGSDSNDVVIDVESVEVSIAPSDPDAAEPSDNGVFTVSLPAGLVAPPGGLTVNYTVTGTADGGSDYTSIATSVVIAEGLNSKTIDVAVIDDDVVELDETVIVTLDSTGTPGYEIDPTQSEATVTIADDDYATLRIGDTSVMEGDAGTTTLSFPVTLSAPVDVDVTVNYQTQDGTATSADADHTSVLSGSVTVDAGATSGAILITVNGDDKVEADETLQVLLTDVDASGRNVGLPEISSDLILHWDLEEGSGSTVSDRSLNNLDSAYFSGDWSTETPPDIDSDYAVHLSGSGQRIESEASNLFPSGNDPRTIAAWVKSDDGAAKVGAADHIVNYGVTHQDSRDFGFMIFGEDHWWAYGWGPGDVNTGVDADTAWHHHAVTYDGTTVNYYLDGSLIASAARSLDTYGNVPLVVGARPDRAGQTYYDGYIDDIRVYARALSAKEVHLASGLGTRATGTILNDDSATVSITGPVEE